MMMDSFTCTEQFYMYNRAKYFGDTPAMEKILKEIDPRQQKKTKIKGYKEQEWLKVAEEVMLEGVRKKFTHNLNLKQKLVATGRKMLVEANPNDSHWGIGMGMHNKKINQKTKWGRNILGRILMQVREEMK